MTTARPGGRYTAFGLEIETAEPLVWPLTVMTEMAESPSPIRFEVRNGPWLARGEEIAGAQGTRLYRSDEADELGFPEGSAFVIGTHSILTHASTPEARSWAEIRLLGPVLSFWLERAGLPVLHASAVRVGEHAVGFLAGNRAGKSSLAAALIAEGYALLTDDLLAVEAVPGGGFLGRSGYPQMRFWPDAAAHWFGEEKASELPRVHPSLDKRRAPVESFCAETLPLSRLYLPERRDDLDEVRIEPLRPRRALVELIARSFIPRLAAAAGWEGRRFETLARLAETVPVRRLVLPEGFERLPEAVAAILADGG